MFVGAGRIGQDSVDRHVDYFRLRALAKKTVAFLKFLMTGPFHIDEERQIVAELRAGSYDAFERIYHRYKAPVAVVVFRLLKSQEQVEDLVQDLFFRVWQHRKRIDPEQPFSAYLFRIAENLVFDSFRKISKDKRLQADILRSARVFTNEVEVAYIAKEDQDLLREAIQLLPQKRREVFVLCKLERKTYEEVSKSLNISLSTVNDHIYKANLFLRQHFANATYLLFLATYLLVAAP